MLLAVVDGQGGGIGKAIVEKVKREFGKELEVIALGSNALATAAMLKAGADEGASGENAVVFNASRADVIIGSIGIISANSMLGELTPAMARAIAESPAKKILIPLNRCGLYVVDVASRPLPAHIDSAVALLGVFLRENG